MVTSLLSAAPFIRMLLFRLHISSFGTFPKPLSAKQELDCLKLIRAGNGDARNQLIEHNLRLVVHIIKKTSYKGTTA